jgi:hypothetical protein
MSEEVRVAPLEHTQPAPDRFGVVPEPFVLANRPPYDESINRAEFGAKLRGIEPTVVAHPSAENGTYPVGYILQLQIVAPMQSPTSHAQSHSLGSLITHRREKAYEAPAVAGLRRSRPKRKAEEIEAAFRVFPGTICISAINDFGLLRVQLQSALRKPLLQRLT